MRDPWTPRQTRIVQRSSEAEVVVEATRSLHASAKAFLASAVVILEQMRAAGGGDDPGQYLRAVAHFVLGTGYELTLKLMLRQSGLDLPAEHRLAALYDAIPRNAIRAHLDQAYAERMALLSEHEATIILTMITADDPPPETDPARPDMKTVTRRGRPSTLPTCHHSATSSA